MKQSVSRGSTLGRVPFERGCFVAARLAMTAGAGLPF